MGTNTRSRPASTDSGAQALAAPVPVAPCSGSKVQRGAPVTASNAATRPRGASAQREVDHRRAHDHHAVRDRRGRARADFLEAVARVLGERHHAVLAEARAAPAVARIEGDQATVARGGVDAVPARACRVGLRHPCVGHAAAAVGTLAGAAHLGVVGPALAAGRGVERDDAVERRAVDEVLAGLRRQQDRRGLRRHARRRTVRGGHVAVAVGPRPLEARHVRRRDLRGWAVVPAERVAGGVGGHGAPGQAGQQRPSRAHPDASRRGRRAAGRRLIRT